METVSRVAIVGSFVVVAMLLRYLFIAVSTWWVCYRWRRTQLAQSKIQPAWPKTTDEAREAKYSLLTMVIFGLVAVSVFNPWVRPYTQLMAAPLDYGWGYLLLSFLATLVVHDTYFYWMHRLVHHKKLFRHVHKVHHLSTNPTPLAALAFHPYEALFEAGIIYVLVFTFPLHGYTIAAFLFFMFAYNVYGHMGWEIVPKRVRNGWVGKWFNTSTHHNAHHQYFHGNYGLYFLWWDRWMGTLRQEQKPAKPATVKADKALV